ncbi:MAG: YbaN family protein [Gammaproteobacteria bacterium]
MRPVYFVLGWCFFGLGAVGAVVPGLPTVPLMLVALWAFSRSSQRFHDWLYDHSLFGPPLQQWRSHRVIPTKAKLLAVVTMLGSLTYMVFFTVMSTWLKVLVVVVMLVGAVFILSQKSRLPEDPG